ncbi:LysR substrate-binding domain-containing protein [Polaribacter undariae]|uniref:LysR substrate-binding domain-containing protein n=1 Tax=Polaribacter sejongensis TaxID=985043 RepID=A0AAJ1QZQ3_9FLAO|nr:LysR substrate-binding domain-containing protein [Polaribacter undariae]MDN3621187.1 LysR substrate-binding domain-containing protein [Polaribacter undariae]UWD33218.1 LysR substrate-binding domain-containing protein [Polaribacter undariae]
MTIQQIKYFLTLASELHFWKTAEKVYISQSSLSRQIQALESEMGIQLFERDKRNVKLTDAGTFLRDHWSTMIKELDQVHRQAKKIDEGTLGFVSISYPGSIAFKFLPNFLEVISSNLPDLKLELIEPTDESHETLLLNYDTDIAFSRDKINHINIDSLKLNSEPICVVVPENHWLTEASLNNINELKNEKFIIAGLHQTTFFASLLRTFFEKNNFEPKTIIESDFGGMILNLVSRGLGISILPYSYQFSKYKNIRFIELNEEIDLFINWRKNDPNKTINKIIEFSKLVK